MTTNALNESAHNESAFNEYKGYESNQCLLKNTYRYISPIEQGSFGKVTLAENITTLDKVAMKAIFKSNAYSASIAHHEIAMLQKLGDNPHICRLVDHFETDDFIILVLEYCANGDLFQMIHRDGSNTLSSFDVCNIAKELCDGLTYAHSLGIYHRDIKPENVLFDHKGNIKICDWGLSTTVRYNEEFDVGTEKYMAPECFKNSSPLKKYDCLYADYWSFGMTLITALFGTSPFKPIIKDGKKSLESDYNFKNFVFYGKHEILYDIYSSMNQNCFNIFMNLFKIGDLEDDVDDYKRRIQSRDMVKFVSEFENNWKHGLTVDEEYELDIEDSYEDVFDIENIATSLPNENEVVSKPYHVNGNVTENDKHEESFVPSLVDSSLQSKVSWSDFEDDLTNEEVAVMFGRMPVQKNDKKINQITVIEKEVPESFSWIDF